MIHGELRVIVGVTGRPDDSIQLREFVVSLGGES